MKLKMKNKNKINKVYFSQLWQVVSDSRICSEQQSSFDNKKITKFAKRMRRVQKEAKAALRKI